MFKSDRTLHFDIQLLSHVPSFVTPWTTACRAPLSSTLSGSLLRLMSIESVSHPTISFSATLFSFCLQHQALFQNQFFALSEHNIGASASVSVLPMSIQDCFPLGLTSLIFLQSKELSRVFSNTTIQKHCDLFMDHSLVMANGLV